MGNRLSRAFISVDETAEHQR